MKFVTIISALGMFYWTVMTFMAIFRLVPLSLGEHGFVWAVAGFATIVIFIVSSFKELSR